MDYSQMSELHERPIVLPCLELQIHIRSENEEQITVWIDGSHFLERVYSVPLFQGIDFDRRYAESLKRSGRQSRHRKPMEGGNGLLRLLVRRRVRGHEINLVGIESGGDRLSR